MIGIVPCIKHATYQTLDAQGQSKYSMCKCPDDAANYDFYTLHIRAPSTAANADGNAELKILVDCLKLAGQYRSAKLLEKHKLTTDITAKEQVKNLVAIPTIAVPHIQKIVPGPKRLIARATPAMLPIPMVPDIA